MSAMNDTSMNTNMHAAFKREIRRIQSGLAKADLAKQFRRANLVRRYDFFSRPFTITTREDTLPV